MRSECIHQQPGTIQKKLNEVLTYNREPTRPREILVTNTWHCRR